MYPRKYAMSAPDRVAHRMVGAEKGVTYGELEAAANRGAHLFRALGLKRGDGVAVLMENNLRYFEIVWAAQRAGLYYTCISTRLTPDEAAYIADDCGARALVLSPGGGSAAAALAERTAKLAPKAEAVFAAAGALPGARSWEGALATQPATPIADESAGAMMLYSSGTTGRPKGVRPPLPEGPVDEEYPFGSMVAKIYGFDEQSIYLSPAPLYHAAPLGYGCNIQRQGGEVVIMDHFDAEGALAAIERHRITHGQFVPTMFVRMLKLPEATRRRYDLSSLRTVIHAAAPCPVHVKQAMIEWWGPIIYEYYAGTEGNGVCLITSEEWLKKPGSVGRTIFGTAHIVGEEGKELPDGQPGVIYFEGGMAFAYHNDPEKTAAARHLQHAAWSTLGDIGYRDADGYIFLTDRKAFTIVSGGVNIYPQEIENLLIGHPKVADVAVIGVPDDEFGEQVKAVVQPVEGAQSGPALEAELIAFCRASLSAVKCPRSVDFEAELPRAPTGKLYKKALRDRYWEGRASRIV